MTKRPKPRVGAQASWLVAWTILPILSLVAWPINGSAADMEVDVELVLAVDVSRSMTQRELEIQRRGYAEALASDAVIQAIEGGLLGRIAVTYIEWAGFSSQRVIVDWTLISNRAEAEAFAGQVTANFSTAMRRTSISGALDYGAHSFEDNGFTSFRRIIDVSGDGPNNSGRPVLEARAEAMAGGLIINGLPLMTREGIGAGFHLDDLDVYYRKCVIGGPGAFALPVRDWAQFPAAVRQKLVLELAALPVPRVIPAEITIDADGDYDCLIGEKMWEKIRRNWYEP